VDDKQPDPETTFKGRQAGFWFVFAVIVVELVAFVIFYRRPPVSVERDRESVDTLVSDNGDNSGRQEKDEGGNSRERVDDSTLGSRHSVNSLSRANEPAPGPTEVPTSVV